MAMQVLPSANGRHHANGAVVDPFPSPPLPPFGDGTPEPAPRRKPVAEGRDASGRFSKGNQGGPGNPHGRRVAELRTAFLRAATPERMQQLAEALFQRAALGDLDALRLFLAYTIGKPA